MLQFITEGCQDRSSSRKLEAGMEAETLEEHCLLAYPPDLTALKKCYPGPPALG